MTPIRRYILITLTVLSLLLLLVTVGLRVNSYWRISGVNCRSLNLSILIANAQGAVSVAVFEGGFGTADHSINLKWENGKYFPSSILGDQTSTPRLGFGLLWRNLTVGNVDRLTIINVPNWFLALLFAIGPAIWLFKWNKRRKLGPNACLSCGYNLTGNETGCVRSVVGTEKSG